VLTHMRIIVIGAGIGGLAAACVTSSEQNLPQSANRVDLACAERRRYRGALDQRTRGPGY
jgi:cation diffusion facilitator CzcD-associated flavoprotein CzcO